MKNEQIDQQKQYQNIKTNKEETNQQKLPQQDIKINQISKQDILQRLRQLNQIVIFDIAAKKGRRQKYQIHSEYVSKIRKQFQQEINSINKEQIKNIKQKLSILYYNLGKLGDNQQSLNTAIQLLQQSQSNIYLPLRWRMQLAAMRSSSNHHEQSYNLAYSVEKQIYNRFESILQALENINNNNDFEVTSQQQRNNLCVFIQNVLKVIRSQKKHQIIWIHNNDNNLKYFINNLKYLINLNNQQDQRSNIIPYFQHYDFHIADCMSLQKLDFNYIEKKNIQNSFQINQIIKQLLIFCSISYFTMATQKYYQKQYHLKHYHFKAIQIALLGFDQDCTYVVFLMKVLNDHYGEKMSQIKQQNSEIVQINQLKRKMPKDKKQVKLKNIILAEE